LVTLGVAFTRLAGRAFFLAVGFADLAFDFATARFVARPLFPPAFRAVLRVNFFFAMGAFPANAADSGLR
jgi:hypothetical protein